MKTVIITVLVILALGGTIRVWLPMEWLGFSDGPLTLGTPQATSTGNLYYFDPPLPPAGSTATWSTRPSGRLICAVEHTSTTVTVTFCPEEQRENDD